MSRDNDSQRMRRRWPEWLLPGFYLPSWLVSVGFHLIVFALLAFWFQRAVDSGGADADDRFVTIFVKPSPDAAELRETPESSPDTEPEETDNTAPTEEVSDLDLDPLLDEPPAIEEIPLLGPIGDVVDQLPNASTQFAAPKRNSGVDVVASQGETKFMGIKDRGTRFVYVVDCSGSMYKHNAINVAKAELRQSISYLDATRQFQVIFYNSEPLPWRPEGRSRDIFYATDANKQRIDQFIGSIDPNHGTHHMPAIMMALKLHPEVLYLLTDAHEPSLTATQLSLIKKRNKGRTRIHTIEFGIGPQIVRENFLTRLARQNGGDSRYLDVTKFDRVGETERSP